MTISGELADSLGIWLGGGLCSLLLACAASASPPASRTGILTRPNESGPARAGAAVLNRLDLRAPDFRSVAQSPAESAPFPSPRRAAAAEHEQRAGEQAQSLGAHGPQLTEESKAQEMARRFHREGLPVARLWESRTALVSFGLNQRGKPGLWLIQKIP